jgi:N-acetylmuramoyl-L-alanine amidase
MASIQNVMQIKNHKLLNVDFKPSPNTGGPIAPDSIVIHYTGGSSASSAISWFENPDSRVSAHIVIARDGTITQMVPFNVKAWHAGPSAYGGRSGFNNFSIGIELDNAGILTRRENGFMAAFGRSYPAGEVVKLKHRNEAFERYWHTYTEQQIEQTETLCRLLIQTYNIKLIVGHEEIAPGRKTDPGPAFPLDKLREKILLSDRDVDEGIPMAKSGTVAVDKLNFRTQPGKDSELVSRPLTRGTEVRIIDSRGEWFQVEVSLSGWVHGRYIKTKIQ